MTAPGPRVAFLYDDSAYVEKTQVTAPTAPGTPAGLMGRQVAGREFIEAFFKHGTWEDAVAVVYNQPSAQSLTALCQSVGSVRKRNVQMVDGRQFHRTFLADPPAAHLYTPCPPDPSFAWGRLHKKPHGFALSGVTHTLCSQAALGVLCQLVTAPYEPYDTLICTSTAVEHMVRTVMGHYADVLRDRFGGDPAPRVALEMIPLGVNEEKYRPPTPEERARQRKALNVTDDEVVILFVGRLSFHAKAHPAAMYLAASLAAGATGKKVHLVLSGWANRETLQLFAHGAQTFAPNVRLSIVDGTRPEVRHSVWHAADIFTSLSDSIQETFGLVIVEAMASGLPVVASDWDGYRDLVDDGETGYLVPTAMVRDAAADAVSRLLTMAELDYDNYLGECNQVVHVDVRRAAAAFARLIQEPQLRAEMGEAGRRRALAEFTWASVVRRYEDLWRRQGDRLREHQARGKPTKTGGLCPPMDETFGIYPTYILEGEDEVATEPDAAVLLPTVLGHPLTNYLAQERVADRGFLEEALRAATGGCTVADLDAVFAKRGVGYSQGRATTAWLLKYAILRRAPA